MFIIDYNFLVFFSNIYFYQKFVVTNFPSFLRHYHYEWVFLVFFSSYSKMEFLLKPTMNEYILSYGHYWQVSYKRYFNHLDTTHTYLW